MTSARDRLIAVLWIFGVAVAALLSNPQAALPLGSYYFRDFTLTFFPLRHFQAVELAAGRLPFWNPYVHEGEFLLPSFYPLDLLHVLGPSPEFISWLLTMHLPLAAAGAFALGRTRGMSYPASFATGCAYALGGFALSTLNLYSFLQALAIAPWMVLAFQKAVAHGGRWIAGAALVLALSLSTLAVEIAGQAVLIGACLALVGAPRRVAPAGSAGRELARIAAVLLLGAGLASIPIAMALGVLPETARGAGLDPGEAGGLSWPPLALLQAVVPSLYMTLARPFEAWWGSRLFLDGTPYFLSIYAGVLGLTIAAAGYAALQRTERLVLLAVVVLGIWYALGPIGGLWNLAQELPLANAFRTPAKALFAPHFALALLVGHGVDRLRAGHAWQLVALLGVVGALLLVVMAVLSIAANGLLAEMLHLDADIFDRFASAFQRDAWLSAAIAALGSAIAFAHLRQRLGRTHAVALLVGLLAFDLIRAGSGINRQAPAQFFALLPDMAAEKLDQRDGGRVFAIPASRSRAFLAWLAARTPDADLWAYYAMRQQLDAYGNVLDRIETAASPDRTRLSPPLTGLGWTGHEPDDLERILPFLRQSGVSHVTSFDPLRHPDLQFLRSASIGRIGLNIYVYAIGERRPRLRIACKARHAASPIEAAFAALPSGADGQRDVVLEDAPSSATPRCTRGEARAVSVTPTEERYEVHSDGDGWLVVRSTYARGWRASIDGRSAPVLRADGRHRAVALTAGKHELEFSYVPPGLRAGLAATSVALIAIIVLLLGRRTVARAPVARDRLS